MNTKQLNLLLGKDDWVYDRRHRPKGFGLLYKTPGRKSLGLWLLGAGDGYTSQPPQKRFKAYLEGYSRGQELARYDAGDTSGETLPLPKTQPTVPVPDPFRVPRTDHHLFTVLPVAGDMWVVKPHRTAKIYCRAYFSETAALKARFSKVPVCGRRQMDSWTRQRQACVECIQAYWQRFKLTADTAPENEPIQSGKFL